MNHPLKNALPIVAAAYGEKFGVKVLIQGQDAFTDGERIVIPTANPDDPHYQQIAWGYLAHEAAHIRHTNFDMVKKASSKPILRHFSILLRMCALKTNWQRITPEPGAVFRK